MPPKITKPNLPLAETQAGEPAAPVEYVAYEAFSVEEEGDVIRIFETGGGRLVEADKQFVRRSKADGARYETVEFQRGKFSIRA